ncbi:MAG TPA: glycosyltransferase [Bacteroidia bacterium]|nr:glycosyltransferase [Bacteroidia bacterium]HNU34783.1 glycosyltransferase [Bacteroidia bacterium]
MKRILLLADCNSPHLQKWATGISQGGFEVGVFSLCKSTSLWYKELKDFTLFDEHGFNNEMFHRSSFKKLAFLKVLPSLNRVIKNFKPHIVHAHYASSYGLLGALNGFRPYFISVWGSDVYDFPEEGFLQKRIIKFNLGKADRIFSTSNVMALHTQKFTSKKIVTIPFGINTQKFCKVKVAPLFDMGAAVIGMVKTMQPKYGVEYLISAFLLVKSKFPHLQIKLLLVGDGTQKKYLETLCVESGIANDVVFTGNVPYSKVVQYHNLLDIAVYPSILDSESFGVAVLESSACQKPVIVSDVAGFKEVVINGYSGIVVPRKNIESLANAIEQLLLDTELRKKMGEQGRAHVINKYEWSNCLKMMTDIYNETN